jgi:hypothetical protein
VAVGGSALGSNSTGGNNTAVGYNALYSNTTASNNTAVGNQAGYGSTGAGNTIMGNQAGYSLTSGTYNNLFGYASTGYGAGGLITTGSKNTFIGGFSGNQGGLDLRTSSNHIVLSDGDGNPNFWQAANNTGQFNVVEYDVAFYLTNNVAYNYDITVVSTSGTGQVFEVFAGYSHFLNSSYGAYIMTIVMNRDTGFSQDDIKNVTSGNGGAWTISFPNSTTVRVTKTAGSYPGQGYGYLKVRRRAWY